MLSAHYEADFFFNSPNIFPYKYGGLPKELLFSLRSIRRENQLNN